MTTVWSPRVAHAWTRRGSRSRIWVMTLKLEIVYQCSRSMSKFDFFYLVREYVSQSLQERRLCEMNDFSGSEYWKNKLTHLSPSLVRLNWGPMIQATVGPTIPLTTGSSIRAPTHRSIRSATTGVFTYCIQTVEFTITVIMVVIMVDLEQSKK